MALTSSDCAPFSGAVQNFPELANAFPDLQANFRHFGRVITETVQRHMQKCTTAEVPELITWLGQLVYSGKDAAGSPQQGGVQAAAVQAAAVQTRQLGEAALALLSTLVARQTDALRPEAGRLLLVMLNVCRAAGPGNLSLLKDMLALTQLIFAPDPGSSDQTAQQPSAFEQACCGPLVASLEAGGWPDMELPIYLLAQIFGRFTAASQAKLVGTLDAVVAVYTAVEPGQPEAVYKTLPEAMQVLRGFMWLFTGVCGGTTSCAQSLLPLVPRLWKLADMVALCEGCGSLAAEAVGLSLDCIGQAWGPVPPAALTEAVVGPFDDEGRASPTGPPADLLALHVRSAGCLQRREMWTVSGAMLAYITGRMHEELSNSPPAVDALCDYLVWRLQHAPRLEWRCDSVMSTLGRMPPAVWAAGGGGLESLLSALLEHGKHGLSSALMARIASGCG